MMCIGMCVLALITAGWMMFLSTGFIFEGKPNFENFNNLLDKRIVVTFVGAALMVFLWLVPVTAIRKSGKWLMILGAIFLAAVLWTPLGVSIRGSRRWLDLIAFTFQPLEFVKVAMVIYLSNYFASNYPLRKHEPLSAIAPLGAALILILMVAVQTDLSGAGILFLVALTLAIMAGLHPKTLAISLASIGFVFMGVLAFKPDKLERIFIPITPLHDLGAEGYQSTISIGAITNGEWFGRGAGESIAIYSLPDHLTDFIFSVICEEWGLIGGIILIAVFTILIVSMFTIAFRQKEIFRVFLGSGIAAMITYQAAIHILVTTRLFPSTGQPLPFVSEGGSSFLAAIAGIGIMLNLGRSINDEPEILSAKKPVRIKKEEILSRKPQRPDFSRRTASSSGRRRVI
jgi:cell division protein FtsW